MNLSNKEFKIIKKNNKFSQGSEGKLYYYDNYLIKIYYNHVINQKKEIINYILDKKDIKGCVLPKDKVYINGMFKGVSTDYYSGYKSLSKIYKNNLLSFKEKLEICKEIIEGLILLHENKIIHNNIDLDNIISNNENALLIDIDGGLPIEVISQEQFNYLIKGDQYSAAITILSYLYDFDFERYINKYGIEYFKMSLTSFPIKENLLNYISDLISNKANEFPYIDKYFNDLEEKTDVKRKIK
ncbi:MAG: hypothetical protein PHI05_03615 [Bacilli bacterium]|nr:hypothetical protein [Bacilli bacterium]MDD4547808.1 hypothetical protein [Bacilli bacterium]